MTVIMQQMFANPLHNRRQRIACGKERFDWVKEARNYEERKDRMIQMGRCDEDVSLFDDTFRNYFESLSSNRNMPVISECANLRGNCNRIEPSSHRNYYDKNSKCFENWYSTNDRSFVEKCYIFLDMASNYGSEESLEDDIIKSHLKCFKNHLVESKMTVQNIETAINILEDRIHFANHCHAFY